MSDDRPYVLAVATAQSPGSVAVLHGEELVAERVFAPGSRGGVGLKPAAEELLKLVPGGRIDLVATALGPGSFTGARVGLVFAQFFAFGRGVPLFGVSDLAALALRHARAGERVLTGVVAHDGRIFGALYEGAAGGCPVLASAPTIHAAEAFADLAKAAAARVVLCPPEAVLASDIGRAAVLRHRAEPQGDDPIGIEPLYLEPAAPERVRP